VFAQDGEQFVALASFCADLPRDANGLPLKVKLLVDCSGSMGGDSIDAAKRALHRILAGLAPEDRFSSSRFGSTVVHETKSLVAADGAHLRAASECLAKMDADLGGTEMPAALRSVFRPARATASRASGATKHPVARLSQRLVGFGDRDARLPGRESVSP